MAEKWLETIPDFQRKIRPTNLNKLILAISRGEWRENGATIVFNAKGELIDGQHRLKAISLSGVPVWTIIVTHVSSGIETFQTIDDGASRSLKDFIQCPNSATVSSVLTTYWMVENGMFPATSLKSKKARPPHTDVIKLGKEYVEYISSLVPSLNAAGRVSGQPSFIVFLAFYHTKIYPLSQSKLSEFFSRLADGVELKQHDPVYQLRKRFLSVKGNEKIKPLAAQAMILKALNLYLDDKPANVIRWESDREVFPLLRGYKVGKNQQKLLEQTLVGYEARSNEVKEVSI